MKGKKTLLLVSIMGLFKSNTLIAEVNPIVKLPKPKLQSKTSIEESLLKRRSVRRYQDSLLRLSEVSQLLWAAQGITKSKFYRTAPSAGATYPLEIYVAALKIRRLKKGIYRYSPKDHTLILVVNGDRGKDIYDASYKQTCVKEGGAILIISGIYERTTGKYGDRGIRYVHMEAGHAAQNIYLQAVSLNLGTVTMGAFYDEELIRLLKMKTGEHPLYILPVGRKR